MLVTLSEYRSEWPELFKKEKELLESSLGDLLLRIHHIGSTSVAGMVAKPIIDIIAEVAAIDKLDLLNSKFESLGYEAMGEFGIEGRRYYRKGGENRTHQIHAFEIGDANIPRHLAFRDYLIANPAVASDYAQLKLDLVAKGHTAIDQYWKGKDGFIKHHEKIAIASQKHTLVTK